MQLTHYHSLLGGFFLTALTCFNTYSQNLHTVLVADGSEHKHNGHYFNLLRLQKETDTIASFANLTKQEILVADVEFTRGNIEEKIKNINSSKNDVIFFYLSGSEYMFRVGNTEKHVIKLREDEYIEIEKIQNWLSRKNAKLVVLIVDLCNSISTERRIVNLKMQAASQEKYKKLFTENSGVVVMVNHFPREQHEVFVTPDGTTFTNAFIHALHEDRKDNRWEALVSRAKYFAISESAGKLHPQAEVNIKNNGEEAAMDNQSKYIGKPADNIRPKENTAEDNFRYPVNSRTPEDKTQTNSTTVKGGNFDKKSDVAVKNLDEAGKANLAEEAKAIVTTFQDKLQQIATASSSSDKNANETELIESAMLLFSDNTREIGISNIKRGTVRKKVKKYFKRLYGIGNSYQINISWYQPTEIENLEVQTNGSYTTKATVYQEFRKTNKAGKLVYGDRVIKQVYLTLQPDTQAPSGFKVLIDDIQVVEGSTQKLSE